jgi:hypothetical protein
MGSIRAFLVGGLTVLVACGGGGDTTIDAPGAPDARIDAPPVCPTTTCGDTCCASPAHGCADPGPTCACPTSVLPDPLATVIEQMDTVMRPPDVLGIGIVDGTDGQLHAFVVAFHPTDTPLDTDLVLPVAPLGDAPFAAVGYDVNVTAQTTRSTYFPAGGTLRLVRRCAGGVAGTLTGGVLREQTSIDDATPHPEGCMLTLPDITFDYGQPCP